jgi:hypothetical protein
MYDPWTDLATRYPHVDIVWEDDLPTLGQWDGHTLYLRSGMTTAEVTSTLTHEIVHMDRGIPTCDKAEEVEEAYVDDEASRKLIETEPFAETGIRMLLSHLDEWAAMLGVDKATLVSRFANLNRMELNRLATAIRDGVVQAPPNVVRLDQSA